MRILTLFILLLTFSACTKSENAPNNQAETTIEKGLIVDIEFVTLRACGHGGALKNIEITLKDATDGGDTQQLDYQLTNFNGRVIFENFPAGDYLIIGEHDYGSKEIEVTFNGDKQVFLISF